MLHPAATPKAKSILLGVQGCRLRAFTQFKRYPKAKSIASSRRSSLPFTTFLFHNAVLDRKLLPTDPSMVYLPCLHVTGHIPCASGANVNIRFLLHNAVPHRKLVSTDCSMVYLPCLHVTNHIPFASRANIHIPFRNDLRIPHLETVTTCAPVIYLARAYTAPQLQTWSLVSMTNYSTILRSFDSIKFL